MGANFGGVIFSSATGLFIVLFGWRLSDVVFGGMLLALLPLVHLWIKDDPPGPESTGEPSNDRAKPAIPGITLQEALRGRAFYLTAFAFTVAQLTYQSVLPQVVPHFQSIGASRSEAAAVLSALALFGMGGKVFLGWLTERGPARMSLIASLLFQVAGLLLLVLSPGRPVTIAFIPILERGSARSERSCHSSSRMLLDKDPSARSLEC